MKRSNDPLDELLRSGVGRHRTRPLGEEITLDDLKQWCEREERLLRLQYRKHPGDPGELPPEWEVGLRHPRRQLTDLSGALSRWTYLSHLYRVRSERLTAQQEKDEDAIRRLLRREPILVDLPSGQRVAITARSYSAMYEIARHSVRLREIDVDQTRASKLAEKALTLMYHSGEKRWQKRYRWALEVQRRLFTEAQLHRQALYAHAFTENGAPAESLADAPDWWDTLTPEDDAALLVAVFDAGHGRASRVAENPDPDEDESEQDFGWHTLIVTLEKMLKVEPAMLYDRDLFQLLAWLQAQRTMAMDFDDE